MAGSLVPSMAAASIAEMATPALLIVGATSLAASALVRMARVVDRARTLAAAAHEGAWARLGLTPAQLRRSLERHARRARWAEGSLALLYAAVVLFIASCLAIPLDRALQGALRWAPVLLALTGALLLLAGGACMVAECRLGGAQIAEEIRGALPRLEEEDP